MTLKLALISGNRGKYCEIKAIGGGYDIEVTMHDLSPPEIQSNELEDVAMFSLQYLVNTEKIVIDPSNERIIIDGNRYHAACVEDSGLFIEALGGFPGVYSSYVFKTIGNNGILRLMAHSPKRAAYFKSVIGLLYVHRHKATFRCVSGVVKGRIATECRGAEGFGYDPIFIPEGKNKTFAEDMTMKNTLSHRARATMAMIDTLKSVFAE